jgi:hypothetical protein
LLNLRGGKGVFFTSDGGRDKAASRELFNLISEFAEEIPGYVPLSELKLQDSSYNSVENVQNNDNESFRGNTRARSQ